MFYLISGTNTDGNNYLNRRPIPPPSLGPGHERIPIRPPGQVRWAYSVFAIVWHPHCHCEFGVMSEFGSFHFVSVNEIKWISPKLVNLLIVTSNQCDDNP